jgi:protein-S-isoprenylcysteine O-methyltransferase Ste14
VPLFLRALFAFLALPGIVAFVVPLVVLRPPDRTLTLDGAIVAGLGIVLLLWCVREFYVAGRGTLAPWSPPKHLVTTGLYRYSRNPMYVGVVLTVAGWALAFRSATIGWYALGLVALFHVRVVFFEEPWLAQTHGVEFEAYRSRVRRWF